MQELSDRWRDCSYILALTDLRLRIICGVKGRDHKNILFINLKFITFFDLIE